MRLHPICEACKRGDHAECADYDLEFARHGPCGCEDESHYEEQDADA